MLETMSYDEVPGNLRRDNPNRKFARQMVSDFVNLTCDAAEVKGWPINQSITAKAAHMKTAVKELNASRLVNVTCSGERVFMLRVR